MEQELGSLLNRRFVYDEATGKMVEVFFQPRSQVHGIMPDLPDFVSPVDGRVVHGRAGLREHDKRNGTTNIADYKGVWEKGQQRRADLFQGKGPSQVETIRRAFDDIAEGRRKRT